MVKKNYILLIILGITIFGVYWKTLSYNLIWDDGAYFQKNIIFNENYPLWSCFKFGYLREQMGLGNIDFYYRPLLTLSFWLEDKLWGLHKESLRIINLILYFLSLCILFKLLRFIYNKNNFPEIATFLFALFPLNIDNIVWIVGRGDLLMLFWGVVIFYFLEMHIKKKQLHFLILSSIAFLLGIFSKESTIFFFPVIVIYEFIRRRKITYFYHLINFIYIPTFFFIKNIILHIRNLPIIFKQDILASLKLLFSALGYYFKSLLFPFYFNMFIPTQDAVNSTNVLLGLLFTLSLIIGGIIVIKIKKPLILLPLALIICFLVGHLIILFTNLYPYRLYTRYMMIPGLGFLMIISLWLSSLKEKTRSYLTALLLILFIPSVIFSSFAYKSELNFWQKAYKFYPKDGYILYQLANAYYSQKQYLDAELYLNKSLTIPIPRSTAILVSLLYADLELKRANFDIAKNWLASIEAFENAPYLRLVAFIKYQIQLKKALISIHQGQIDLAEKIFKENIKMFANLSENYRELYNLLVGYEKWNEAEKLEKIMKKKFPLSFAELNTQSLKEKLANMSLQEKYIFFIKHRNFNKAISLMKKSNNLTLEEKFLLAKLYYLKDDPQSGESLIKKIQEDNSNSPEVMNKIGFFYLGALLRPKKALKFFKNSLQLNPKQPQIIVVINDLEQFLKDIKDPWHKKRGKVSLSRSFPLLIF